MKNHGKPSKSVFAPRRALYRLAKKYVRAYEGFSYDFDKNGEKRLIENLKKRDVSVVFDVGANVGDWTNIALQAFPVAEIHSFELSKATFETLSRNVASERCSLNNLGLGNHEGEVVYKDYGDNAGVNTLLSDADFHDHRIQPTVKKGLLTTGDSYCSDRSIENIDFLKIDVEGAENLVLEGFHRLLTAARIGLIQFEYGYTHGDAHFLMKDFFRFFESYDYIVGVLKPKGVIFSQFHYRLNDFNSGPNFVAVHKNNDDVIRLIETS